MKKVFKSGNVELRMQGIEHLFKPWKLDLGIIGVYQELGELLVDKDDIKKIHRVCAMFLEEEGKGKKK